MGERDGYAQGEFCWVDVLSHGIEGVAPWYQAIFGWELDLTPTGGGPLYGMFLLNGKRVAGIGEANVQMKADGHQPVLNNYVRVDDCAAVEARAKALGATSTLPTITVPGDGTLCAFKDPQGATLSLWQPNEHFGAGIVNEPGAFAWNELATRDLDASMGFYGELFGWDFAENDASGAGYRMIRHQGKTNGSLLLMTEEWKDLDPHWHVYFAVSDTDATAKRATDGGGEVHVPPFDMPLGRMAVIADPQGATFAVVKRSGS